MDELLCLEALLRSFGRDQWSVPLTVDELLMIAGQTLEPFFRQPPIGPIPEYLVAHWSVYGCVAEYEDELEELDRWKAFQLTQWLKDRIGKSLCVAGRVFELQGEKWGATGSERFWFKLIADCIESYELT